MIERYISYDNSVKPVTSGSGLCQAKNKDGMAQVFSIFDGCGKDEMGRELGA
jgi:hypothetical protein